MISVHEYEMKPGVEEAAFESAIHEAEHRGLFELPGLIGHHFLKGFKGQRRGAYAALWIFESVGKAVGTSRAPEASRGIPSDLENLGTRDPLIVPNSGSRHDLVHDIRGNLEAGGPRLA